MKKITFLLLFQLVTMLCIAQVTVKNLLTENLSNPLGIDETQPRFSWQLSADKRNTSQTAYEIKVTADKEKIWNSGKVTIDQSVQVLYAGAALQSGKKYSWQVRVWDNSGKASAWSDVATFQMALLNKGLGRFTESSIYPGVIHDAFQSDLFSNAI